MALSTTAKFDEYNKKTNTPNVLIDVQIAELSDSVFLATHFSNNSDEENVDYTTDLGTVQLDDKVYTENISNTLTRSFNATDPGYSICVHEAGKIYKIGVESDQINYFLGVAPSPLSVYDIATDTWTELDFYNDDFAVFNQAATIYNGDIYVLGGGYVTSAGVRINSSRRLIKYNIATATWSTLASSQDSDQDRNTLMSDGSGLLYYNAQTTISIYDIATDTWSEIPSSPSPAIGFSPALVGGAALINGDIIHIIGNGTNTNDYVTYTISTDTWTRKTDFPYTISAYRDGGRYLYYPMLVGDVVYVMNDDNTPEVLYYDELTSAWVEIDSNFEATTGSSSFLNGVPAQVDGLYYLFRFGNTSAPSYTYYPGFIDSGYIQLDLDLGTTPSLNGEWQIIDSTEGDSTIVYTVYYSSDGITYVEIGDIVDGDAITDLYRYYRVKAVLTSSTGGQYTPILRAITASFSEFESFAFDNSVSSNYEPAVKNVSSLTTSIDMFESSSVGQMTVTFGLTKKISNFLKTKSPRNKIVNLKFGFVGDDFTLDDYLTFFTGQISDFRITQKREVVVNIQDFKADWSINLVQRPSSATAATPQVYTDENPVTVMLDILQNRLDVRDSKIDLASFNSVRATPPTSTFTVTRTINEEEDTAKNLLEELRVLTSCFYIPDGTGAVKLKRWDPDDTEVASFNADFDFKQSNDFKANYQEMYNRFLVYYDWNGDGNEPSDFSAALVASNTTSITNNDETKTKTLLEKWTDSSGASQISTLVSILDSRYAQPPAKISFTISIKHIAIEVGDTVKITTTNAPSSDLSGITEEKFQITNKNINFSSNTISIQATKNVGTT